MAKKKKEDIEEVVEEVVEETVAEEQPQEEKPEEKPVEKPAANGKVAIIRKGVTVYRHESDLKQYLDSGWKIKE